MKKLFLIIAGIIVSSAFTTSIKAQVLTGVYLEHNSSERKPIPYQYLREADVMWSKVIWRRINLTEKMNLPLYYPTTEMEGRKSLIQIIMWGIKNKSLTAFADDEFSSQLTLNEIDEKFGATLDTTYEVDPETGESKPIINKKKADYGEVKEIMVKEMWFFDKQRSVMEVRVIGLCPIRIYYRDDDLEQTEAKNKILFWIFYPEARNIFANQPVYNPYNQAESRTFDDVFFKRLFSGYIYKESNVYNNRRIEEYTTGLEVLLESDAIKEKIFDYEHDLWEF
jgi:gliding motility associated protien GldN